MEAFDVLLTDVSRVNTGCPRRSYKVLFSFFYIIRLLERSYFCIFLWKGLIKVLFLVLNETSILENRRPDTSHKNIYI